MWEASTKPISRKLRKRMEVRHPIGVGAPSHKPFRFNNGLALPPPPRSTLTLQVALIAGSASG